MFFLKTRSPPSACSGFFSVFKQLLSQGFDLNTRLVEVDFDAEKSLGFTRSESEMWYNMAGAWKLHLWKCQNPIVPEIECEHAQQATESTECMFKGDKPYVSTWGLQLVDVGCLSKPYLHYKP